MKTFEECRYAAFHKPTKKWVTFDPDDSETSVKSIAFVDNILNCDIYKSKTVLEAVLKSATLGHVRNYANENFLEFEVVKLKVTYTVNYQ